MSIFSVCLKIKKKTLLVFLYSALLIVLCVCFLYVALGFLYSRENIGLGSSLSDLEERTKVYVVNDVRIRVPERWHLVSAAGRVYASEGRLVEPVDSVMFRYGLKELTDIESPSINSDVMVYLKPGFESDLHDFFSGQNESWKQADVPEWGLTKYSKENPSGLGAVYFLPKDLSVETVKGGLVYYWCQSTHEGAVFLCFSRFEIAAGLMVEYRIHVDCMSNWKEIHNGVERVIAPMLVKK